MSDSPRSSTSAHSSNVNPQTVWNTRVIVAVSGRLILGSLDDIFGRILFLFLWLFCSCIVVGEFIPSCNIYQFREKRIIIWLIALRLALLKNIIFFGLLPLHTGFCNRWYGNITVKDMQEGFSNYRVWRVVFQASLRRICLSVVSPYRQYKQLMDPGSALRETQNHTHACDGSTSFLV